MATINGDKEFVLGYRAAVADALAEINVAHRRAMREQDTEALTPLQHRAVARYLASINARVAALAPYRALPEQAKPRVKLIGTDGNVFALAGKVRAALWAANQPDRAQAFMDKLPACHSYDEALALMQQYVEVD